LNGRPPVIFEDGGQSRDFVHVSDIVTGVLQALEAGRGDFQALNLATGAPTTVRQVCDVLAELLHVDLEPELRQEYRAGDIRHCIGDITRARSVLGFEPTVAFREGMGALVEQLRDELPPDLVDQATAALVERGLAG
jgi:dTDP-L-rhamnose 4-epimerase